MVGDTTILFGYDTANNLSSYCDAGGTNNYTYDPTNNLSGVGTDGGTCTPGSVIQPCTTYTRDNNNQVNKVVWPTATGMQQCEGYDNAGHLINLVATEGTCTDGSNGTVSYTGTAYDNLSYSYETAGGVDQPLLQAVTDNTTTINTVYTYNNLEYLTLAASGSSGPNYG